MAAKMEKTKTPGIFKRGGRYVFSYRVNGRQRWDSCRTLEEARREKAARTTDIGRGEFDRRSRITLREYALDYARRLTKRLNSPGPLSPEQASTIHAELAVRLPEA